MLRPISVCIITHAKGALLRNTLKALAPQIRPDDEIILLDDGGEDRPIAQEFVSLPLRYIYLRHQGYRLSLARNLGIQLAIHDKIALIDGDCIPQDGWLTAYRQNFEAGVLLAGRIEWMRENGLQRDSRFDYATKSPGTSLFEGDPPGFPQRFWGGNVAGLRQDWAEIGYFAEEYNGAWGGEEADAGWRIYYSGKQIKFLFGAFAIHQHHSPSPHKKDVKRNMNILTQRKEQYSKGDLSSTWTKLEDCDEWEEIPL